MDIDEIDPSVGAAVRMNLIDTLACAIAGSSASVVDVVADVVAGWGGAEQADLWVRGGRYPAHHAAWVNSAFAHARDFDDTDDAAVLHAGIVAVPSAVAALQLRGDGTIGELLSAVGAGLEVMTRLGRAIQSDIAESGFIYSSLIGYFGAAAAAGRALRLDPDQMWDAFGIAYSSAAGSAQVTPDASDMKRLQPGLAAQAGVVAAQLALRGVRGVRGVFEGEHGLGRVYLRDRFDPAVAQMGLGESHELMNLSYKPYPSCRNTHAAIDAVLQVRESCASPRPPVQRIRVGVTGPAYRMVCLPKAVREAPTSEVEAQFSIPYGVAAAWEDGYVGVDHFTPGFQQRSDILTTAAKVETYVDDRMDALWSRGISPAVVSVDLIDGASQTVRVDYPRGHPSNPMQQVELVAKLEGCLAHSARPFRDGFASRMVDVILTSGNSDPVDRLLGLLVPTA